MFLLRFFITLPEALPIPDGATYDDHQAGVGLLFHEAEWRPPIIERSRVATDVAKQAGLMPGAKPKAEFDIRGRCTVVEVVTHQDPENRAVIDDVRHMDPADDFIARTLVTLNTFLRALRVAAMPFAGAGSPSVEFQYEQLPPMVPLFRAEVDDAMEDLTGEIEWSHYQILAFESLIASSFDAGLPVGKAEEDLRGRLRHYLDEQLQGSPLWPIIERMTNAYLALERDGAYAEAVIRAVTATEVLIYKCLSACEWENARFEQSRVTEADVASVLNKRNLKGVVSALQSHVGGKWGGGSAFDTWRKQAAMLRNRIVHAGYYPSRKEANSAYQASQELHDFVHDLLAINVRESGRFLRVAMLYSGANGLAQRGAMTQRLSRLLDDPREPLWRTSFGEWDKKVVDQLGFDAI